LQGRVSSLDRILNLKAQVREAITRNEIR
jgi:hypothetical protein